eukprot:GEMP01025790.1.p1 GENE.GEMP01025790.1~~GEMP01025790.1.p1  ORF type:complete len:672 (+),score=131.24 GEMP01025790.1:50-2065(+)
MFLQQPHSFIVYSCLAHYAVLAEVVTLSNFEIEFNNGLFEIPHAIISRGRTFADFDLRARADAHDVDLWEYKGITVSFLTPPTNASDGSPLPRCCTSALVREKKCIEKTLFDSNGEIDQFPLQFVEDPPPGRFHLKKPGRYRMLLSNCGHFPKSVFVSGKVVLTSSSTGLLPDIYREQRTAYKVFTIIWAVLFICSVWECYRLQGSGTVFHRLFLLWGVVAFVECLLWWTYFELYKIDGIPPSIVGDFANVGSVCRTAGAMVLAYNWSCRYWSSRRVVESIVLSGSFFLCHLLSEATLRWHLPPFLRVLSCLPEVVVAALFGYYFMSNIFQRIPAWNAFMDVRPLKGIQYCLFFAVFAMLLTEVAAVYMHCLSFSSWNKDAVCWPFLSVFTVMIPQGISCFSAGTWMLYQLPGKFVYQRLHSGLPKKSPSIRHISPTICPPMRRVHRLDIIGEESASSQGPTSPMEDFLDSIDQLDLANPSSADGFSPLDSSTLRSFLDFSPMIGSNLLAQHHLTEPPGISQHYAPPHSGRSSSIVDNSPAMGHGRRKIDSSPAQHRLSSGSPQGRPLPTGSVGRQSLEQDQQWARRHSFSSDFTHSFSREYAELLKTPSKTWLPLLGDPPPLERSSVVGSEESNRNISLPDVMFDFSGGAGKPPGASEDAYGFNVEEADD